MDKEIIKQEKMWASLGMAGMVWKLIYMLKYHLPLLSPFDSQEFCLSFQISMASFKMWLTKMMEASGSQASNFLFLFLL